MKSKYQLPRAVRMQVIWLVRDYERMKLEYDNAIWTGCGPMDGLPRGNRIGNPTERDALKRIDLSKRIEAIEQALNTVPEEYRKGVWDNLVDRAKYPIDAGSATYARHKGKFLYRIAKNLYFI
ncbi:hypothetical protein NE619_10410 [Anaerovorax odorimutans]|uniref:Uncharacterized protein n=1 Tax=Anaerovorax odorimutans TaxID=109327 RepID=A0ABT1RPL4_9FIRM|nr:hypothetical protein [Anaerovorax odorimutans]MCQ4637138.1 hypothetical protein [Anaerovorax odorimutans]